MITLKTGDRVKIKPLSTVQNRDFHNAEGVVTQVLDVRTAFWPIGVAIEGFDEGPRYFSEIELEFLNSNIYQRPAVAEDSAQEPDVEESLTAGVVDASAALSLLSEAQDSRLDMAIEYLEGRRAVYHHMYHALEGEGEDQAQLIYALVHDEVQVAIRLLEQHREEEGVFDAE